MYRVSLLQPRSNASPGDEKKANGALPHAEANSSQSKSREAVLDSLLPRLSKLDTKMEFLGSGSLRGPPQKNVFPLQKRLDVQIPQPHVFGKMKCIVSNINASQHANSGSWRPCLGIAGNEDRQARGQARPPVHLSLRLMRCR